MIVQKAVPVRMLIGEVWGFIAGIVVYAVAVSLIDLRFHLDEFQLPIGVVTVLGTALGILLGFRTNAAYGRWWEARIIWGRIVNDSRTWTRQLLTFTSTEIVDGQVDELARKMARRQIAWCYSLARSLRRQDPFGDADNLLDTSEQEEFSKKKNGPNAILAQQGIDLKLLYDQKRIDSYQLVAMESTLMRLTDSMGGCERINNTPFPRSYGLWIYLLIYVFVLMLPFALVEMPAIGLIAITIPIALGFLFVEKVATYLEDPFVETPSTTAMLTLSRVIEINIRQMIGDQDIPKELAPQDGVLY